MDIKELFSWDKHHKWADAVSSIHYAKKGEDEDIQHLRERARHLEVECYGRWVRAGVVLK